MSVFNKIFNYFRSFFQEKKEVSIWDAFPCIQLPNEYKEIKRILVNNVGFHMFLIQHKKSKEQFVIKYADIKSTIGKNYFAAKSIEFKQEIMKDLQLISQTNNYCKYLLQYPEQFSGQVGNDIYIITEYFEHGTIKDQLWSHQQLHVICEQMMCAIEYLHSLGFSHEDISPENIGIRNLVQLEVALFDFEAFRIFQEDQKEILEQRVSRNLYASRNAHNFNMIDDQDDYECLYYVLFELMHGRLSWSQDTDVEEILHKKEMFWKNMQYIDFPKLHSKIKI